MEQDWNLTIRGFGPCLTPKAQDKSKDAEVLIRKFIDDMRAAGHTVRIADFTPGHFDLALEPSVAEKQEAWDDNVKRPQHK